MERKEGRIPSEVESGGFHLGTTMAEVGATASTLYITQWGVICAWSTADTSWRSNSLGTMNASQHKG
jgi:hypothetical protein